MSENFGIYSGANQNYRIEALGFERKCEKCNSKLEVFGDDKNIVEQAI